MRIGLVTRRLLGEEPVRARIGMCGSFLAICIILACCIMLETALEVAGQQTENFHEKLLEITVKLVEEQDDVRNRRSLSQACVRMGNLRREKGCIREALEYYEKSLEICETLSKETERLEVHVNHAAALMDLAGAYKKEGKFRPAEKYYKNALRLLENLAEQSDTPVIRRNRCIILTSLGDICVNERRLSDAALFYGEEIRLYKQMSVAQEPRAGFALGTAYGKQGYVCRLSGDIESAIELCEKGIRTFQ